MIGEKKKVKLFNGRYKLVTLVTLDAHGVMSRKQPLAGYKAPLPDRSPIGLYRKTILSLYPQS